MTNKIQILDCTLRDGGYYNNWKFNNSTINNYLQSMSKANIDIVEIGFRFIKKKLIFGKLANTHDEFLNKLEIPNNIKLAIMINGEEYNNDKLLLDQLFLQKKNSKIDLIRIAINIKYFFKIKYIAKYLKKKKYHIAINLMQSNDVKKTDLIKLIKEVKCWNCCDVLYFADSLGTMDSKEVRRISNILFEYWGDKFGFHSHNNRGLALTNSLEALKHKAKFIDSTVLGMGRGAGNTPTESLILELNKLKMHNSKVKELYNCFDDFRKLQKIYEWGPNIFYHIASINKIHPTYIQTLLSDKRYSYNQILGSIDFLSKNISNSYDKNIMFNSIYFNQNNFEGKWKATNWLNNKKVLIIGSGPSLIKNKKKILNFISKNKLKIIFLNINNVFDESIAHATIACHEARILGDLNMYKKIKNPLIIPYSNLNDFIKSHFKKNIIYDYGLSLKKNSFKINPFGCEIKWPLAIAYALSIITEGNASNIYLAGFDGYDKNDIRQNEMNEVFKYYKNLKNKINLTAITSTTYKI
jgi:4-hydroxy 2-oxovalerate aldolase